MIHIYDTLYHYVSYNIKYENAGCVVLVKTVQKYFKISFFKLIFINFLPVGRVLLCGPHPLLPH